MKASFLLLSLFSLSLSPLLIRWAGASPDAIGFWRMAASCLMLTPFVWRLGRHKEWLSSWKQRLPVLMICAAFFFAHLWTYTYAAQNTRVAHCMILFATNPLWTALGAWLLFQESISWRVGFAYIFALAGIFQLVRHSFHFHENLLVGDLSALISAFLCSGYLLTGKMLRSNTDALSFSCFLYGITALLFGLSGMIKDVPFSTGSSQLWWGVLGLVIFPTILGHSVFNWLMRYMNLNVMSCSKLLEPVIASLLAVVAFGELLTEQSLWAFTFTAIAVILLFLPQRPKRRTIDARP